MPVVADVVRRYGPDYRERFGRAMPAEHRKVLNAIAACRTGELGTVVYACSRCGHRHHVGRSCGNRHCPTCQQNKARAWLEKQTTQLLPCPYFLLTFTLPAELRRFVRSHQRVGYAALFAASSAAIKLLAADPKYVGTHCPGFFGTLHTWGRSLTYHPHVHYVVSGGGPNYDGSAWLPSKPNFFVPVKALSIIFRARFRDELRKAGLLDQINPVVWKKNWVVHSQPVGDGRATLKYLAAYVFRVAITDRRIRSCDYGQVTFSYAKAVHDAGATAPSPPTSSSAASSSTSCPPASRRCVTTASPVPMADLPPRNCAGSSLCMPGRASYFTHGSPHSPLRCHPCAAPCVLAASMSSASFALPAVHPLTPASPMPLSSFPTHFTRDFARAQSRCLSLPDQLRDDTPAHRIVAGMPPAPSSVRAAPTFARTVVSFFSS